MNVVCLQCTVRERRKLPAPVNGFCCYNHPKLNGRSASQILLHS